MHAARLSPVLLIANIRSVLIAQGTGSPASFIMYEMGRAAR